MCQKSFILVGEYAKSIYSCEENARKVFSVYSEIGGRASGENTSASSSPTIAKYSVSTAVFSYVQNRPRNERTDHTNNWNKRNQVVYFIFL